MSVDCLSASSDKSLLIETIKASNWHEFIQNQSTWHQTWAGSQGWFERMPSGALSVPSPSDGAIERIWHILPPEADFWSHASLLQSLMPGDYRLDVPSLDGSLAFVLGCYRYASQDKSPVRLITDDRDLNAWASALYWVRDLINMPADTMGPKTLVQASKDLEGFGGSVDVIEGDALIAGGYRAIEAVGRASSRPPCLIEIRWGDPSHPKLTLVGKGVCFDTGGLNIKQGPYMRLMKKDMGGAAHALGLAHLIMVFELPIQLQVLIPACDNSISGNAFRPGDVIKTRAGHQVEIADTDAEGRLILADALDHAKAWQPALILDMATLTGAARVALGTDMPAVFAQNVMHVDDLVEHSHQICDPLWRMPLYQPYQQLNDSYIADFCNASKGRYAGAITAALFLQQFVSQGQPWCHIDMMAWNESSRPGRPEGGEAMGLRALLPWLEQWAHRRSM